MTTSQKQNVKDERIRREKGKGKDTEYDTL